VEVTCSWWLMPFVKGKMEQAHRGICDKVIEKVMMEQQQRAIAGVEHGRHSSVESPNKGKSRVNPDKDLPGVPQQDIHGGAEGVYEVDGLGSQRVEMPADAPPEKITYR
jgi:hypothetical protein